MCLLTRRSASCLGVSLLAKFEVERLGLVEGPIPATEGGLTRTTREL